MTFFISKMMAYDDIESTYERSVELKQPLPVRNM